MSVKLMTTDQIQNDLASVAAMWAGGIPPEQQDRVNALKSELKRRGVGVQPVSAPQPTNGSPQSTVIPEGMTDEQLAKELQSLGERISKNPGDDSLQEQFANVRFELRKRAKNGATTKPAEPPQTNDFKVISNSPIGQAVGGTGGNNGMPTQQSLEAMRQDFADRQAAAQKMAEDLVRKHTVANLAARVTSGILSKYADPDGDDIENACTIGVAVAKTIADKVGL